MRGKMRQADTLRDDDEGLVLTVTNERKTMMMRVKN